MAVRKQEPYDAVIEAGARTVIGQSKRSEGSSGDRVAGSPRCTLLNALPGEMEGPDCVDFA